MQVRSLQKLFPEASPTNGTRTVLRSGKGPQVRRLRPRRSKQEQVDETKLRNRVLIVGRIRELALYRAEVLRHAGFRVRTPQNIEEAMAIVERGDFDVAVLSYTLPSDTVQQIADHVREHRHDCPIVAITETDRLDRRIAPDALAVAAEGPQGLLLALLRVLKP